MKACCIIEYIVYINSILNDKFIDNFEGDYCTSSQLVSMASSSIISSEYALAVSVAESFDFILAAGCPGNDKDRTKLLSLLLC